MLQKHITKALQTHSQAIHSALDSYNATTHALIPPCQQLEWKEVIKYAFLADFDLLCDACQDNSHHPWATPTGWLAMGLYYKMLCTQEEIDQFDIEVHCVATYCTSVMRTTTFAIWRTKQGHPIPILLTDSTASAYMWVLPLPPQVASLWNCLLAWI